MITAILSCRNAEATLERCLNHLFWHGANVIVIENGSTDGTRNVLRRFLDVDLRHDPYTFAFDLTRQLRLKQDIIREVGTGWIIHADADEFIDTPEGLPLKDILPLWEPQDIVAFPTVELMYLPTSEEDHHDSATFETTMNACVRMSERDPKQRVFRADAPLKCWLATGGHTILKGGHGLATNPLILRHYPALSLDHFRAKYLSRVFAPGDLGKSWHTNRIGAGITVVPPKPEQLSAPENALSTKPARNIPVFADLPDPRLNGCTAPVDLEVLTISPETKQTVVAEIESAFPGIRIGRGGALCPKLAVFEHPARSLDPHTDGVHHAEHWLRLSAGARQTGMTTTAPYADIRIETAETRPAELIDAVRHLLSGNATAPIFSETTPVYNDKRFKGRLAKITGPFATDLGYC